MTKTAASTSLFLVNAGSFSRIASTKAETPASSATMNIVDWVSGKTKHAESAIKAVEVELDDVGAKLSSINAEAQKLSDLRRSLIEQSLSCADVEAKLGKMVKTRQPIEETKRNLTEKQTAAKEARVALDPLVKFSKFCEAQRGQVNVTEIESVRDLLKHVSVACE